jgi:hypothetical protein
MENDNKFMKSDIWRCPLCGATITVHVELREPPVCYNRTSHSSKVIEMQPLISQVKKKKG